MVLGFLFLLSFIVAFILPNHYYPWGSYYLEFSAFCALFFAQIQILIKCKSIVIPRLFLALLLVSLVPLLQWVSGLTIFRSDALLAFFYLAGFALTLIVSRNFASKASSQRAVHWIALAIVLIGIVSTGMALAQWLNVWNTIWIHSLPIGARPYANLAQPNNFASLIWISIFSLYFLFESRRIGMVGLILVGLFLIFGAALAQSRTSWLLLLVILVSVAFHAALFRRWRWHRLALPICAMVAFFLFSWAVTWLTSSLFSGPAKEFRTTFTDIRLDMWQALIHAILEQPWFGYGWGQVSAAQYKVAELYPAAGLTQYAHNMFLDLLIWNGVPLGLLLIVIVSYCWGRLFLAAWSRTGFYSFCGYTALFVHALLEYPHAYAYFLLLAGFFVGISFASDIDVRRFRSGWRMRLAALFSRPDRWLMQGYKVSRTTSLAGTCIFLVLLAASWKDYRLLEEDHRLLRFEVASIGTLRAEKKAPDVLFFDQLQGFIWVARTHDFDDLTADEHQLIEHVAKRYALPMPLYKLARSRLAQDRPQEATESLNLIRELHGEEAFRSVEKSLAQFMPAN